MTEEFEENESSFFSNSKQITATPKTSFNGFQTAQYESVYNAATAKLVQILQDKCMELLSLKPISTPVTNRENFAVKVLKLEHILKKLEANRSI